MKRTFFLLLAAICCSTGAMAAVDIDSTTYEMDTLLHRTIGPGIVNTIVRLPDYPLNVYVLEADLTHPNLRVETTIGYSTVGRTENLTNAYTRNRTATKRPVAMCNANFWVVSGTGAPANQFQLGTPLGAVVRNDTTYVNTNMSYDQWDGGYSRTGASVYTHDRRVHLGHFAWAGTISNTKIGTVSYANVNRRAVLGEVALWNGAYTSTREFETNWTSYSETGTCNTDNYYLTFAEGESWQVNAPMKFVVSSFVNDDVWQTLGTYDACISVAGDANSSLSALAVGDEVEVTSQWTSTDCNGDGTSPTIQSMVEGNAQVMHNGELTTRNYDESYNSMVYSRTAYGCNADGTRLYMVVIDKSTSKLYGQSAGCSTAVMCQILKNMCPDISEVINYDAGGSAEMLVLGDIINTTTEGTPRAVACGWMLVAEGEEDSQVVSIAFEDYHIQAPVYSSFEPRILGYNKNGELVDENITGFTLSCDEAVGTTEGNVFIAGGNAASGTLTCTYNGLTCTVPVTTLAAQPAIAIKPTILLDDRDYPIEVTATVGNNTYYYDPTHLDWTTSDSGVASIVNGTMRGIKNGEAHITCTIGTLVDEADVNIEISETPYINQDWTGWTLKQSGASNVTLGEDGVLSFTYSGGRAPYLSLKKDITFYSLPDTIAFTFVSTIPIEYIQVDTRNNSITSSNYVRYEPDGGFEAGKEYTILADIDTLGGADNVSTYPVSINEIKFTPVKGSDTGEHTITFKKFYSHYSAHTRTFAGDVNGDGDIDITDVDLAINMALGLIDETEAADVDGSGSVDITDVNIIINLVLGK